MSRKILLVFLCAVALSALVLCIIFIGISRHASQTIGRLRKEKGPQKIEITEIPLVRRKGWEVFANSASVWDIAYHDSRYYMATSGGIVLSDESGKVVRILHTTWGLPENSYRQLLPAEHGIYALSAGGNLVQLKKDIIFKYDLKRLGRISSITGSEENMYIGSEEGVFVLREDSVSTVEEIARVNIAKPFMNGIVAATTHGTVHLSTSSVRDSITGLDAVNDLYEDENALLIATPLGLVTVVGHERRDELQGEFLTAIAECEGGLCFGTFDGRMIMEGRVNQITERNEHINRLSMVQGKLFACTSNGVYVRENEKWRIFYKPQTAPLEFITAIYATGGELLIGTFEHGCYALKGENTSQVTLGEAVNEINQIMHEDESVFIATNSGLFELRQKGSRKIEGLASNFVNCVSASRRRIIAGTSCGFCIVDLSDLSVRNYGSFHGLINNRVYAAAEHEGKIILGTLGGISVFDGSNFKNITSANSTLKSNWVNDVIATGDRIYVGTYGGGIAYIDKKGIQVIDDTEGIEVNAHSLYYQTPYLFAGTCKNGLLVYNEKEGRTEFLRGIFPLDDVTAVCADEEHYYIGTEQGFYRIDKKELPL